MKSLWRKDGDEQPPSSGRNGELDIHREKRNNEAHGSIRKGDEKTRNSLILDIWLWKTDLALESMPA